MEATYEYITNEGTLFYIMTNFNASKNKIITIDINKPEKANWKTIIPE